MEKVESRKSFAAKSALYFVILLGCISLFSDMVYEGARSISGAFLALLGASGVIVGSVAGLGELVGYTLRIVSGYWVDKSQRYWLIAFLGYLSLLAIPALAFVKSWEAAACLIILERVGKAIRTPARDAMLSYATKKLGRGIGFGLHEAFDQAGGVLGPLVITSILFFNKDYQLGFLVLIIPAIISLLILLVAKNLYPEPQNLEVEVQELKTTKIPTKFWIFLIGSGLIAAGYIDFPLAAFHFQKQGLLTPLFIPIFYMAATGSSTCTTLLFGYFYDRIGVLSLILAILIGLVFAPLIFLGGFKIALLGCVLWGIGMGAQRSLLKAVVGDMVAKGIRGRAYGLFNTGYGIAWFLGSAVMGYFYDVSIGLLILFSILAQLMALPFLFSTYKSLKA